MNSVIQLVHNLDTNHGGPARSVPILANGVQGIGMKQQLVSVSFNQNEKNDMIEKYNLKWVTSPKTGPIISGYSFNLKKQLQRLIIKEKYNLVHTHNLWNYIPWVASKVCQSLKINHIISPRGSLYEWNMAHHKYRKMGAWYLFQRSILENCACIHATALSELEAIRELGIRNKIAVIPNGVNVNEFDNIKDLKYHKSNFGLDSKRKYILFCSRIEKKKNLNLLIKSFCNLADFFPEWDLLIVGPIFNKQYFDYCMSIPQKLNLSHRILYKGFVRGQKRIDAYGSSQLFVLPSFTENFGMAIAEALLAGIPVITSTGTPWLEINKHNAGWVVDPNLDSVQSALKDALNKSSDELIVMGKNGIEIAKGYSSPVQAKKMYDLYAWSLGKGFKPDFVY
jgi:glycosyltransferase involved in cell wall biosynthesis